MRGALALIVLSIAGIASAQTSEERIDAIWDVASNRMVSQQDAWFDDGDFLACISLLRVEAEKWPADYEICTNLGWMEENVQDWSAALETYQKYRADNPKEPDASLPEATYYFMKKQYDKVPDLLEPAIKVKCHPNNYRVLAWTYEKLKKYPDATRVWKVYLDLAPNDLPAKRNMARDEKRAAAPSSR